MTGRYKLLFTQPGALWLSCFGLLGRLPNGMLGLVFVLVTVRSTGSYAAAGLAAALYTVGTAVGNPAWSRGVDRWGPRPILLITGTAQGVLLLVVAAATMGQSRSAAILVLLAALCGALVPPLGAIMRTLWSRMFRGSEIKQAAFAYESVVVDLVFIVGPSIVAVLTALADPSVALIIAGVATASGSVLVAASPHTKPSPRRDHSERHWLGPLRFVAVLGLLPIGFLLMGSITVIEVSLVAFAEHRGAPALAGVLIAVLSVGGVAGGFYWGARRQPGTNAQQLLFLLAALAIGWGLLASTDIVWLLGALLLLAGVVLNPAITAQFSTLDDVAPEEASTESFGWLNALASAGAAVGASVVGLLVTERSEPGFLLATGMCAVGFLIAAAFQSRWRSTEPVPVAASAEQPK
ncbi:MAG TPA: MFS transporter [Pseudonocardiaceae bacterium]|jgi:MFS family permease|nr:MFS transporter [Pseudonocardiaceae bacterium]